MELNIKNMSVEKEGKKKKKKKVESTGAKWSTNDARRWELKYQHAPGLKTRGKKN